MTLHLAHQRPTWLQWAATGIGLVAVLGEIFIAVETLLSGYLFGLYDLVGVALGMSAIILVWKRPLWAALPWLGEEVMLYNGHLLVSIACLPILLLPLSAAALAIWSWSTSRSRPQV